jgi:outer membrane autotransporter protein
VAGVINTTIFSQTLYGKIVPVGAASIGNALQVNVTVTGPISNGTSFNIVDATSGTNGSTVIATDNSLRYLFSAAPTANGLVRITTTQIPLAAVVAPVVPGVNPGVPVVIAPVIDALPVTSATASLLTAITLLPTAAAIADALAQLGPGSTNLASPLMSYRVTQRFQDLWASHLQRIQEMCGQDGQANDRDRVRLEDDSTCQPNDRRPHWWVAALGNLGEQGSVNGFEGYDSRMMGAMLAYDAPLSETTRGGVGVRYARSSLDAKISDGKSHINSYQATAYLGHAEGPWFINASLSYGWDHYSGSRHVVFPGVDSTAHASYNGTQFTGYGTTGYRFYVGDGRTIITPIATLQYTLLHADSYTETGGGGINLRVNSQGYEFAQVGIGGRISRNIELSEMRVFRPEFHANVLRSLGGVTPSNTATFESGGTYFTTLGLKPNRNLFDVGAGVALAGGGAWSIEGVYDYQWQSDRYSAHQVMINFVLQV